MYIKSLILATISVGVALSANLKNLNTKEQSSTNKSTLTRGTFTTKLNHFNPTNSRTHLFHYDANLEFYQDNGPLFIYIKPLQNNSIELIENGLMVDIAKETNGALFTFDTRYSGENVIFEDLSFENLVYLTADQILGDIATLASTLKSEFSSQSSVILWGSQNSGTYAAWARLKYPHLIDGVWSSSSAFGFNSFTYEFYNALNHFFNVDDSHTCSNRILTAIQTLDLMILLENGTEIQNRLNLCKPVDTESDKDVSILFETVIEWITNYAAYSDFEGFKNLCNELELIESELDALVQWATGFYLNSSNTCFQHSYDEFVETHQDISANNTNRALLFHQCTQMGNFKMTTEFSWLPDRVPFLYHLAKCRDVFGENYNQDRFLEAAGDLYLHYGGFNIQASKVIYANGFLDLWNFDGLLTVPQNVADIYVLTISHYAQSFDLLSIEASDSESLVEVKKSIKTIIAGWSVL